MQITKRQLRRIIKEECGAMAPADATAPVDIASAEVVLESESPEQDILVEMEVASRSLEAVVESVQNAAQVCHNCGPVVAAQAPLVEAMVAQAEALQEMLEAQVAVIQENVEVHDDLAVTMDIGDIGEIS